MKTLVVVLAVCIISANAILIDNEHIQQLRLIRNQCIAQSGLNPFEIINIIKAVRPVGKLVNASTCIVKSLIELRETSNVVSNELNNLHKAIDDVIAACDNSLGPDSCDKLFQLLSIIIQERQRRRDPIIREV